MYIVLEMSSARLVQVNDLMFVSRFCDSDDAMGGADDLVSEESSDYDDVEINFDDDLWHEDEV